LEEKEKNKKKLYKRLYKGLKKRNRKVYLFLEGCKRRRKNIKKRGI